MKGVESEATEDMTDEEEYSYSGYDDGDGAANVSAYVDGDEEYSYSGYASGQSLVGADEESVHAETAVTDIGSYGDFIIEEFSVEAHVKKVVKYIKLPESVAQYILAVLYLVVGVLCVVMPMGIEVALPYIVGGGMTAVGLVRFVYAVAKREYRFTQSNMTASSLIIIGLGVMLILEHSLAHTFIPIVWGILGLFEGAHAFNHAFSRISRGMRSSYFIIKGIVEVVVAFLLLYKPEEYAELHIIVFGVSLIVDGLTTLPFLNKLLTKH